MGIIAPKKLGRDRKVFFTLLFIGLSPILVIPVLLYFLWGAILYIAIWSTQRQPFIVFVYSDSPTWKDYITREILPDVRNHAIILNWSERRHWKNSLAVLAFRYFGGRRNFNPMGMVFRPFRAVKAYRFFEAFREFKHGDTKKVQEINRKLLADIKGGSPTGL
jgi:hypothetical protein